MNSSAFLNSKSRTFLAGPGERFKPDFVNVVSFSYCDGPEDGVALNEFGDATRFLALADSPSRMFRVFEFALLSGDWRPRIRPAFDPAAISNSRVLVAEKLTFEIQTLESEVRRASSGELFVGIGVADLAWLYVSPASENDINTIRAFNNSTKIYRAAHQFIKRSRVKNHEN
jgi:hypothetical protein